WRWRRDSRTDKSLRDIGENRPGPAGFHSTRVGVFSHTVTASRVVTKNLSTGRDSDVNPGEGSRVAVRPEYHPRDSGAPWPGCLARNRSSLRTPPSKNPQPYSSPTRIPCACTRTHDVNVTRNGHGLCALASDE